MKFVTVFPTTLKVFTNMEKVRNLFKDYDIKVEWLKDAEFKIPVWD